MQKWENWEARKPARISTAVQGIVGAELVRMTDEKNDTKRRVSSHVTWGTHAECLIQYSARNQVDREKRQLEARGKKCVSWF